MTVGVVVLLGPPGSGKGTQAKVLAEKNQGWVHISTGDLFRAEIASSSPLGKSVKDILASGLLVSDDVTNQVFQSQLEKILGSKKPQILLLDGYPRTRPQAKFLVNYCRSTSSLPLPLSSPLTVELLIPVETVVSRLSDRLVNPRSGKVYHRVLNPPKVAGICDDDKQPLVQRPDDRPEVIQKRFHVYQKEKDGIASELGLERLKQVQAQAPLPEVTADLEKAIREGLAE